MLLHLAHSLDVKPGQLFSQNKARVTSWLRVERVFDLELQNLLERSGTEDKHMKPGCQRLLTYAGALTHFRVLNELTVLDCSLY